MKYTPTGVDIVTHLIQVTSLMRTLVKWWIKHLRSPDFLTFFSNRESEIDEGHAGE